MTATSSPPFNTTSRGSPTISASTLHWLLCRILSKPLFGCNEIRSSPSDERRNSWEELVGGGRGTACEVRPVAVDAAEK